MKKLNPEEQESFDTFSRLPNDEKVLLIMRFQREKEEYKDIILKIKRMFDDKNIHLEDECDCIKIERYINNMMENLW